MTKKRSKHISISQMSECAARNQRRLKTTKANNIATGSKRNINQIVKVISKGFQFSSTCTSALAATEISTIYFTNDDKCARNFYHKHSEKRSMPSGRLWGEARRGRGGASGDPALCLGRLCFLRTNSWDFSSVLFQSEVTYRSLSVWIDKQVKEGI